MILFFDKHTKDKTLSRQFQECFELLWEKLPGERYSYGFRLPHTLTWSANPNVSKKWYFSSQKDLCILKKGKKRFTDREYRKAFSLRVSRNPKEKNNSRICAMKLTVDHTEKILYLEYLDVAGTKKFFEERYDSPQDDVVLQKHVDLDRYNLMKVIWRNGYFVIEELVNRNYHHRLNPRESMNVNIRRKVRFVCKKMEERVKFMTCNIHEVTKMTYLCRMSPRGKIYFLFFTELKTKTRRYKGQDVRPVDFALKIHATNLVPGIREVVEDHLLECNVCRVKYERELMQMMKLDDIFEYGNNDNISRLLSVIYPNQKKHQNRAPGNNKINGGVISTKELVQCEYIKSRPVKICSLCYRKIKQRKYHDLLRNKIINSMNPDRRSRRETKYDTVDALRRNTVLPPLGAGKDLIDKGIFVRSLERRQSISKKKLKKLSEPRVINVKFLGRKKSYRFSVKDKLKQVKTCYRSFKYH